MALSSAILANNGYQTAAEDIRNLIKAQFPYGQGVSTNTDFSLSAGSGSSVNYSSGYAFLYGTALSTQGAYFVWDTVGGSVPWPASDPSNPRIDALVLVVTDAQYGTASGADGPAILVVSGTAAGSPVAPLDSAIVSALPGPGAWYRLGNVRVPAAATLSSTYTYTDTAWTGGNATIIAGTVGTVGSASAEQIAATFTIGRNTLRVGSVVTFGISSTLSSTFGGSSNQAYFASVRLTGLAGTLLIGGNNPGNPTGGPTWGANTPFPLSGSIMCTATGSTGALQASVNAGPLAGFLGSIAYQSCGNTVTPVTVDTTSDIVVCLTVTQGATSPHALNLGTPWAYRNC
jgi:hypothetical protein